MSTSWFMSPYIASTLSPLARARASSSCALKRRCGTVVCVTLTISSASLKRVRPTVRASTWVTGSKPSPSLPHSTSTVDPSCSFSQASPSSCITCPSHRSWGWPTSTTIVPLGESTAAADLKQSTTAWLSSKWLRLPSRMSTMSNPPPGCGTWKPRMSPSMKFTDTFSAAALPWAYSTMCGLSSSAVTWSPLLASSMLWRAGPAPSSRADMGSSSSRSSVRLNRKSTSCLKSR
mmetsp:Transcript_65800/g.208250  ORF Transcript_65800/g.208250 Transcript_65800/m.208250 type:complete len:233 (+) Transcript_65800:101-799(+)